MTASAIRVTPGGRLWLENAPGEERPECPRETTSAEYADQNPIAWQRSAWHWCVSALLISQTNILALAPLAPAAAQSAANPADAARISTNRVLANSNTKIGSLRTRIPKLVRGTFSLRRIIAETGCRPICIPRTLVPVTSRSADYPLSAGWPASGATTWKESRQLEGRSHEKPKG